MVKIPEPLKQLSEMGTLTWRDILDFYGDEKGRFIFEKWASIPLVEIYSGPERRIKPDTKVHIFTKEELKILEHVKKKKRVKIEELQKFADKNNISISVVNNFINKRVVKV
jgi:hypothetical protein